MLIEYGKVHVDRDWDVNEKTAPGFVRIYFIYDGYVEYYDENGMNILNKNTLYIFPSSIPYFMIQDKENRLKCTYFHIEISPSSINNLIKISPEDDKFLNHLIYTIDAAIESKISKILNQLVDIFETYCMESSIIQQVSGSMKTVLDHIDSNLNRNISIKELSSLAGYNSQYFIRTFKKEIGQTPYKYIINRKMNEAKKLLRKGLTITEITRKTGYQDIKSFSRAFKSFFEISPSMYKNTFIIHP